ncbi:MAG: M13 family metallopeptidase [Bacteroidia bacterium]
MKKPLIITRSVMHKKIVFIFTFSLLTSFIFNGSAQTGNQVKEPGVDVAGMNKKVNPRKDFYQFANGNWCKKNPIPASEARWTNFSVINERNNELLRKVLEDAGSDKNAATGSVREKIGNFYRVAMDTMKAENEGSALLMIDLKKIENISATGEIIQMIAEFHKKGISGLFSFDVGQDPKKSDRYISFFAQGGLGLPDRDYYFKEDEKSVNIRDEYKNFISNMFTIYGYDNGRTDAEIVYHIEKELAHASMTRVERRDQEKQYNKWKLDEFASQIPLVSLKNYTNLNQIKITGDGEVLIAQPEFFKHLNHLFEIVTVEQWKIYLKWKLINGTSSYVSRQANQYAFDFYGKTLTGVKEQKPRWKRVVASANSLIGELVAQEYVKVAFSAESKKRVNEMVDHLREAFAQRIQKLDWMSDSTKQKAMEKLLSFSRKLGYPDKWKDYSKLQINRNDSYLELYYKACEFSYNEDIGKLFKPVDRTEWEMLPQTVNAYYNPVNNEIVFPASIMQPPFFNPGADDAVNYGAIGAVIGHEFSHGFDDQGRKYDAKGNMNNWWTEDDRKKFDERTKILVDLFNKFSVEDKVFVNGELTLGENIADLAGITIAFDAYQISLKDKPRKVIDGFDPEQRFFIGYAQVWRVNSRPEFLRQQVVTDSHSPGKFRVLGPLPNLPSFYAAFGIRKGDPMYRHEKDRAKIW